MSAAEYAVAPCGTWAVPVHLLKALRARLKRMHPRPDVEEHLGVDAYHVAWRSAVHNGAVRLRTPVRYLSGNKVRVGPLCTKHHPNASSERACDVCRAAAKWHDVAGTVEGLRDAG